MSAASGPSPSFAHWLGRQVGHIRRAIRKEAGRQVIYRRQTVEEHPVPTDPNLILRRTTTDEVVVEGERDEETK